VNVARGAIIKALKALVPLRGDVFVRTVVVKQPALAVPNWREYRIGQTIDRLEFGQQSDESPSRDLQRLAGGLSIYTHTNGSLSRSRNRDRCRPGNGRWVVQDEIQLS
jgi:hypothetical protein